MHVAGKRKKYVTYNRIRLALFIRAYVAYAFFTHLRRKYKINKSSTKIIYRKNGYKNKIPDLVRFAEILNIDIVLLRQTFTLNKKHQQFLELSGLKDQQRIKAFLSIEQELITLSIAKADKESLIKDEYECAKRSLV